MFDLSLAIAHHLLIFGIFGIFCAEFWAIFAAAMARGYGEF
jgi:uncharacterized membrane protein